MEDRYGNFNLSFYTVVQLDPRFSLFYDDKNVQPRKVNVS